MDDGILKETMEVQGRTVALRNAGVRAGLSQEEVEVFVRSDDDGSQVLYLNDAALKLYREIAGDRPVEASMDVRPPETADEGDILGRGVLLLRSTRFALEL
jgi:hypothetical protein